MKISKDLKKVIGVRAASYYTTRRRHCEFKTRKRGTIPTMSQLDVQSVLQTSEVLLLWPSSAGSST